MFKKHIFNRLNYLLYIQRLLNIIITLKSLATKFKTLLFVFSTNEPWFTLKFTLKIKIKMIV